MPPIARALARFCPCTQDESPPPTHPCPGRTASPRSWPSAGIKGMRSKLIRGCRVCPGVSACALPQW
ncbi:hypothetical protein CC85DRAFT_136430 [Cutaneotrichosporon oleaginosum]|uniref:Uncharacterized protein n=1 Tax=Cutaneotrichosporon oleaginosum TaxID=879819 RepID=A0A0J1BBY4_9TREE|nr:uncharacterized protein CC85DRAFT_136430 [Cutaneotrichosporon oleaginosum]KLT45519.1 hypothetical protein CC85DRAFT_136430 [Cutaneotrichosporon oleaginosum]TXT14526.1 hypothetical protein COLE_00719 [Cutaneotrichosporon oleaginosum]